MKKEQEIRKEIARRALVISSKFNQSPKYQKMPIYEIKGDVEWILEALTE